MEIELLSSLRWRLHPPTTFHFVNLLVRLIDAEHEVLNIIKECVVSRSSHLMKFLQRCNSAGAPWSS